MQRKNHFIFSIYETKKRYHYQFINQTVLEKTLQNTMIAIQVKVEAIKTTEDFIEQVVSILNLVCSTGINYNHISPRLEGQYKIYKK